jgi:hypothetical protein
MAFSLPQTLHQFYSIAEKTLFVKWFRPSAPIGKHSKRRKDAGDEETGLKRKNLPEVFTNLKKCVIMRKTGNVPYDIASLKGVSPP